MTKFLFQFFGLFLLSIFTISPLHAAPTCPQKKPLPITMKLIQKINAQNVDSSNANTVEKLIGPPCSCYTADISPSSESWACQWKGDLSSNRIENTLTIFYEAGMLSKIIAIDANHTGYMVSPGEKIQRLPKR